LLKVQRRGRKKSKRGLSPIIGWVLQFAKAWRVRHECLSKLTNILSHQPSKKPKAGSSSQHKNESVVVSAKLLGLSSQELTFSHILILCWYYWERQPIRTRYVVGCWFLCAFNLPSILQLLRVSSLLLCHRKRVATARYAGHVTL